MNAPFSGQVALVTGGGNGIGAATAVRLAFQGALVHVVDIDQVAATQVAASIRDAGGQGEAHQLDVSDPDGWNHLRRRVPGRLDVLVNNAYTATVAPILDQTVADWDRQMAVNLTSVFHAVKHFLPALLASGGAIVNVASVHAVVGVPGYAAYAASKGGIVALTRQLAVEHGPRLRANAVLPGPILTAAWSGTSERDRERSAKATAAKRLGRPDEVATAICFLASPEASYISGATLLVDGGWTAKKDSA